MPQLAGPGTCCVLQAMSMHEVDRVLHHSELSAASAAASKVPSFITVMLWLSQSTKAMPQKWLKSLMARRP
jgi:hypothetical protein